VAALGSLSLAERFATMRQPAFRAQVLEAFASLPDKRQYNFSRLFPLSDPPNYEPSPDTSIAAQAERRGLKAAELAYDLLLEGDGRALYYETFANYHAGDLRVCREMIAAPNSLIGLGDGGAHVGMICDSSFPTFLLSHWSRECGRADGFDLSWLIKRQTKDAADFIGLHDRGTVEAGKKADLNVLDVEQLGMPAPRMKLDLPAGGKRLLQGASGYRATIVSGQVTQRRGEATGALPGRLLHGPQRQLA
jgi:N-acyl-D-aspartate/D-glutamate deacylase